MKPINFKYLEDNTGHYFTAYVMNYLTIPVCNWDLEVQENHGETYFVLRVLNTDGDYHVFVQRAGEMIVDVQTVTNYDLEVYRKLVGEMA